MKVYAVIAIEIADPVVPPDTTGSPPAAPAPVSLESIAQGIDNSLQALPAQLATRGITYQTASVQTCIRIHAEQDPNKAWMLNAPGFLAMILQTIPALNGLVAVPVTEKEPDAKNPLAVIAIKNQAAKQDDVSFRIGLLAALQNAVINALRQTEQAVRPLLELAKAATAAQAAVKAKEQPLIVPEGTNGN